MQYVKCRFHPNDTRFYTYEWDGEPLAPGDFVKVPDAKSDGWKRVEVMEVTDQMPNFVCKPVLGKVTGEDADERLLASDTPSRNVPDGDPLAGALPF